MIQATSNTRQIYIALTEFDQDYGKFPDEDLITKHPEKFRGIMSDGSNRYLGMLISSQSAPNEEIFYAEGKGIKKPDTNVNEGHILEPGECGFTYIRGQSSKDHASRVLLLASTDDSGMVFDYKIYDHKAVILNIDGSVKTLNIGKDTKRVRVDNGRKDLFDTGAGTVWGDMKVQDFIEVPLRK